MILFRADYSLRCCLMCLLPKVLWKSVCVEALDGDREALVERFTFFIVSSCQ